MGYESFIGLRYLRAKRSNSVVSIITIISASGVALGVTALIVVLSVMGGFKKDLKQKILGTRAHIVIQGLESDPIEDFKGVAIKARASQDIVGASAFLEGEVMVSSPTNLSGVILRGIDIDNVAKVSTLEKDMKEGSLLALRDDKHLMNEVKAKRKKDLDVIMNRIDNERDALKKTPSKVIPFDPIFESPEGKDAREKKPKENKIENILKEKTKEEAPVFKMPPLPGEETGDETGEEDAEEFIMPALPGSEETSRVPGLIIGRELQTSLQVKVGDEVNVVTPNGEMGPMGPIPRSRPFRIVGVFYSGMYEYDANYAYTSIEDGLSFLKTGGATGIELRTKSVENATETANILRKNLNGEYKVLDWKEINSSLFFALKLEKIAMFVVLAFIILVASFSIIAMLIMIVIEKGREIAILKSIGASNSEIRNIFIFQGMVIGTVGSLIGLVGGLAICLYLSQVGFPLNSEVYYINTLPVDVNPAEIIFVLFCAIGISFIATIYPAYQASKLNPVDGLRYE